MNTDASVLTVKITCR